MKTGKRSPSLCELRGDNVLPKDRLLDPSSHSVLPNSVPHVDDVCRATDCGPAVDMQIFVSPFLQTNLILQVARPCCSRFASSAYALTSH